MGGERYADALEQCDRYAQQSGALSIHAFDSFNTLLGTGTIGMEIDEQTGGIDTVLASVGGGGLIGGISLAVKSLRPQVKVLGVVAAVHAVRAMNQWALSVGGLEIPVWGSWVAAVGAGSLCVWAFRSGRK